MERNNMEEFTRKDLEASHNTMGTMSGLLENSMRGLTEKSPRYNELIMKLTAYKIARSLIFDELKEEDTCHSTKDELEVALEAIESERTKIACAPGKTDCCMKLRTLFMRQSEALDVASFMINKELSRA